MNRKLYSNVGRNENCPCGSLKKFKKCCIDKLVPMSEALIADNELGQQRIREYDEEQKKIDWSLSLKPLSVI